jgi:methylated-DNA-protein-cysteine methyltransferase related protein
MPTEPAGQNKGMRKRILAAIRTVPRGKVSTYGAIARAAGYPGAARQVAWTLHRSFGLPWQRVVGAGGEIRLRGDSAIEQRLRLEAEGVAFRGRRVDMARHEFRFPRAKASHKAKARNKSKSKNLTTND